MSKSLSAKLSEGPLKGACGVTCLRGLTLLEVMIALAVFSIGILAAASLAGTSMKSMALAQGVFYDSSAAARFIECVLARPYIDDTMVTSVPGYDPLAADCAAFMIEGGATIEWEVQHNFPTTDAQRIRVTVRRPYMGKMRLLRYEYIKAKEFR
jgi:prepilin-type N-terminal cleavage/methylation domain-containing protein